MKKKLLLVILALALMASVFIGCESYHQQSISGGDADAAISSNGGYVVKQGDYVYFVNGLATPSDSDETLNYFGNVRLGAIMRAKYDQDTASYSEVTTIVPKMAYNTATKGGIYVFGEWIYYTSPSKLADKDGVVQIGDTEFLRTKIDGTDTQSICVVEDNTAMSYVFTEKGLVYVVNNNIYCVDLTASSFKKSNGSVKTIAESVRSYVLPEYKEHNYGTATVADQLSQYVYYTKALDDDISTHNQFIAVSTDGKHTVDLSEGLTYKQDTVTTSVRDTFVFNLIGYSVESDGLAIYYTKSTYIGGTSKVTGTFAVKFTSTAFDHDAEIIFTPSTLTSAAQFMGLEKGIIEKINEVLTIFKQSYSVEAIPDLTYSTIIGIHSNNDKDYIYYYASDALYRYALAQDENVSKIGSVTAKSDWIPGDFVGDDFFFIGKDVSYLYRINLATYDRNDVDEENLVCNIFGLMTDEAYAAYEEDLEDGTIKEEDAYSFEFAQK